MCRNKDTNSRFGGRDCDRSAQDIYKFSNAKLSQKSLAAAKFVEAFDIGLEVRVSLSNCRRRRRQRPHCLCHHMALPSARPSHSTPSPAGPRDDARESGRGW